MECCGVWMHLLNVRKMYTRARGTPFNVSPPWEEPNPDPSTFGFEEDPNNHPFVQPWWEKPYAIFMVHGIHGPGLDAAEAYASNASVANTVFKRLWWAGFAGRLCFYKWPALSAAPIGGNPSWPSPIGPGPETPPESTPNGALWTQFNESEWRAYCSGGGRKRKFANLNSFLGKLEKPASSIPP